uniref:Adipose-secreted signaling protein n=1 Tax=Latimeria chalumnae TaxID=7897 RepID=H3ARF3_LATCH|nr:PREDICTED: UPF0687 protein C20orf27 homolog [Latimeria chalumnae]|eukprot:XP_006005780.1 PREDICTED: UPF0687 protein C20orf27 homolog [Latimeria chalumnae]
MAEAKKEDSTSGCHKVCFVGEQSEHGSQSHVHFDEKLHDSVVMVTQEENGSILVKVGFLKTLHKYEIVFTLPDVHKLGKNACVVPAPSQNLKVTDITPVPEGKDTH